MAQPVTAILSRQEALSSRARQFTRDANEAGLLVGRVVSRAFTTFAAGADDEEIVSHMNRDLDRMIAQLRQVRR